MTKKELIKLIKMYPEFVDDLDETACPTGFVTCPICDGGGYIGKKRKYKCTPTHRPDCPRKKFEDENAIPV